MKPINYIILLLTLPLFSTAQSPLFEFRKLTLIEIETAEAILKGEKVNYDYGIMVSGNYMPGLDSASLTQPLLFKRNIGGNQAQISYFIKAADSSLRMLEYNWDFARSEIKKLQKVYMRNAEYISKVLEKEGPVQTLQEVTGGETWKGDQTHWENARLLIRQFSVIGANTHRVRITILFK